MRVKQLTNNRGKHVANHFVITDDEGNEYFQSYETIIAFVTAKHSLYDDTCEQCGGKITLDRNAWDYSKTTSRWRNYFLGLTTAETKKLIESGEIVLDDLN